MFTWSEGTESTALIEHPAILTAHPSFAFGAQEARSTLARLRQPDATSTLPDRQVRPLGAFSDFVVNELGTFNQRIKEGLLLPGNLFHKAEELIGHIPEAVFQALLQDTRMQERRLALLDLVFVSRSLDIAFVGDGHYKEQKQQSLLFLILKTLADKEQRYPTLQWSDTAIYTPADDPRSFLPEGKSREQELLLYKTQRGIEQVFKVIVQADYRDVSLDMLSMIDENVTEVVNAMVYLNRMRDPGQFAQVDPFLGPNDDYPVFASGSFSVWAYLAGYFLSGNETFREKLLDPQNRPSFDRDGDQYIELLKPATSKR